MILAAKNEEEISWGDSSPRGFDTLPQGLCCVLLNDIHIWLAKAKTFENALMVLYKSIILRGWGQATTKFLVKLHCGLCFS